VLTAELEEILKQDGLMDNVTRRSHLNEMYRMIAMALLLRDDADAKAFQWLRKRKTILSELGRFRDEKIIRELAATICAERPNTRSCIARLRAIRCQLLKLLVE